MSEHQDLKERSKDLAVPLPKPPPPAGAPETVSAPPSPPSSGGSGLWILGALILLGVGGYFAWAHFKGDSGAAQGPPKPVRLIPVVASRTRKGDMNLYLTGLGTVTALKTVTIRSRVDGQIDKVPFIEGQLVHEGDLLYEIDPRPFQRQLDAAQAQLSRDQAILANSKIDLERFQQAKEAIPAQQLATQIALVSQNEALVRSDQAQIDSVKLQLIYCQITSPITGRIGLRLVDLGNQVRASDATALAVVTQTQPISVIFSLPEDSLRDILPKIRSGAKPVVDAYDRDLTTRLASGTVLAIDNQVDQSTGTIRIKAEFANENESLFSNQFVNARLLTEVKKDVFIVPTAAIQRSPQSAFVYVVKLDAAGASTSASPKTTAGEAAKAGTPKEAGVTPTAPADAPKGRQGETAAKTDAPKLEGVVETRNVKPGPSEGEEIIIDTGLSEGEVVVTDGVDKLVPGTRVTVRMSRPATGKSAP
jgi:multidrug efflux system membrane fusion protein